MPTFVPSSFSSTMREGSAIKPLDSFGPRCLSSWVPLEPERCGVRGYLTKSSRVAPIILSPVYNIQRKGASFASLALQRESVLEEEFRALEPGGEVFADRLLDDAGPCEPDQGARLRYNDITEHCIAGGHTPCRRIGEQ